MTSLTREYISSDELESLEEANDFKDIADLDCSDDRLSMILTLESGERLLFHTSEWAQVYLLVPKKKPIQIMTIHPQGEDK